MAPINLNNPSEKRKIWVIRKQDKSRTSLEKIKFIRITAKDIWQDYKTNENILS
jgi:hypothetical protein